MKNIHIIPTDKPSRLVIDIIENKLYYQPILHNKTVNVLTQHIYITNSEEIKEGDYIFETDNNITNIADKDYYRNEFDFKIILTTDQSLDSVQDIDDEFLEWFVKNPSCVEVEVQKFNGFAEDYLTIISKEEPKQETVEVKRNYEKHSLTKTKGYKLWCNIIQRCYNPKNHSYKYYGEKGVIMEDYFKNSYENFINWIKGIANYDKWLDSSELSLDRIDNTLGYVRGNIKFSTKTEQVENQNLRLDNKSGYKGICYHKINKKYGATITINKSKVFLGYYDTALEAALVYDNYVLKNNLNRKTNL